MKNNAEEIIVNRELQKATRTINLFISSCAHTMRGPLKSIEGLANLLCNERNYPTDEAKVLLMHIQHTAAKMELTLDALENILENSHQIVRQKSIYFHELLNTVLAPYQQEIDKAEISIHYSVEESIPFYTDISRLRIILSNLLANAISFRDNMQKENEINISVRTTPSKCIIAISDNGEGIEPENHEKIFNLFFRASEKSKGAGIGLYIVQDMLEKLGGSISVDSLPNKGSIFTVTIPNGQPTNN